MAFSVKCCKMVGERDGERGKSQELRVYKASIMVQLPCRDGGGSENRCSNVAVADMLLPF